MTESEPTRELMSEFKKHPDLLAIKLADRFTAGIPDVSVDGKIHTWLELKYGRSDFKSLVAEVKKHRLQLEFACDLERIGARIFYIGWLGTPISSMQIWQPLTLRPYVYTPLEAIGLSVAHVNGKAFDTIIRLCREEHL